MIELPFQKIKHLISSFGGEVIEWVRDPDFILPNRLVPPLIPCIVDVVEGPEHIYKMYLVNFIGVEVVGNLPLAGEPHWVRYADYGLGIEYYCDAKCAVGFDRVWVGWGNEPLFGEGPKVKRELSFRDFVETWDEETLSPYQEWVIKLIDNIAALNDIWVPARYPRTFRLPTVNPSYLERFRVIYDELLGDIREHIRAYPGIG